MTKSEAVSMLVGAVGGLFLGLTLGIPASNHLNYNRKGFKEASKENVLSVSYQKIPGTAPVIIPGKETYQKPMTFEGIVLHTLKEDRILYIDNKDRRLHEGVPTLDGKFVDGFKPNMNAIAYPYLSDLRQNTK